MHCGRFSTGLTFSLRPVTQLICILPLGWQRPSFCMPRPWPGMCLCLSYCSVGLASLVHMCPLHACLNAKRLCLPIMFATRVGCFSWRRCRSRSQMHGWHRAGSEPPTLAPATEFDCFAHVLVQVGALSSRWQPSFQSASSKSLPNQLDNMRPAFLRELRVGHTRAIRNRAPGSEMHGLCWVRTVVGDQLWGQVVVHLQNCEPWPPKTSWYPARVGPSASSAAVAPRSTRFGARRVAKSLHLPSTAPGGSWGSGRTVRPKPHSRGGCTPGAEVSCRWMDGWMGGCLWVLVGPGGSLWVLVGLGGPWCGERSKFSVAEGIATPIHLTRPPGPFAT